MQPLAPWQQPRRPTTTAASHWSAQVKHEVPVAAARGLRGLACPAVGTATSRGEEESVEPNFKTGQLAARSTTDRKGEGQTTKRGGVRLAAAGPIKVHRSPAGIAVRASSPLAGASALLLGAVPQEPSGFSPQPVGNARPRQGRVGMRWTLTLRRRT